MFDEDSLMDEKSGKQRKTQEPEADAGAGNKPSARPVGERAIAGTSGANPLENLMLRREVRIGMAVLAVLVVVLGYVFVSKINAPDERQTSTADADDTDRNAEGNGAPPNPPPTVVTATARDDANAAAPGTSLGHPEPVYAGDAARHDLAPPNPSYLPRRNLGEDPGGAATRVSSANEASNASTDPLHAEETPHTAEGQTVAANGASTGDNKYGKYGRYADETPFRDEPRPNVVADAVEDRPNDDPHARSIDQPAATAAMEEPVKADPANAVVEASPRPHARSETSARAPTTPRAAAVETPRSRTYVTADGDTPALIAKAQYEDARLAAALMAYNGVEIADDVALTPGGEVLIPPRAVLEREFARLIPATNSRESVAAIDRQPVDEPAESAGTRGDAGDRAIATRIYTVARGETLYDIARRELGRVSRWREILELNAEQLGGDIDAIAPGMKLVLPDEGRSSVARQRGELLWG
ncbi:MAG: hypothetical protein DCC68_21100 [Planctomycetota bacterium]|nr:MAG: hypothetical protein DCC68_21100 [Planctomycetota bacterium]